MPTPTPPPSVTSGTTWEQLQLWSAKYPALVALFGVVLGSFLTVLVWPTVKGLLGRGWSSVSSRLSKTREEKVYLNSVIEQHRYLPILPSTLVPVTSGAQAAELDDLYVALATINNGSKEELSAGDAIKNNERIVILGDPGSGKTTLLRYLALTIARARRGSVFSRNRETKIADRERVLQARNRVKNEYGLDPCPIPIFVYLNRLKQISDWPDELSLLDYLREEWATLDTENTKVSEAILQAYRVGQCIFLFDAFDELATDTARGKIATLLGVFCSQAPEGNRFVVSSRIVGYQGQLSTYGFRTVTIQKLPWNLVTTLVTRWYRALKHEALSQRLLDAFKANPRLLDLAANPMLLSLIVLVQYVLPLIPDKRHVLYEECIKVLIERRYAPPSIQASYNDVLPSDEATSILKALASHLHREGIREVSRPRLQNEILPRILSAMPLSRAASLTPRIIINNIEERSQLIVERGFNSDGKPVMAFSHLTFQEYLVSAFLHGTMSTNGKKATIAEVLDLYGTDPEWWQEPAVLFAAQLESQDHGSFLDCLKAKGSK
jgi:predicted NACHT family NTPase